MYGYIIASGYKGRLPDGTWMLFSTETEYKEYIYELAENLGVKNQMEN